MVFLKIVDVTKKFGKQLAVNDVNLEVEKGEFVVILGPSGSGKSTLLRLIAGLEDPDEGDIILDGKRINDIDPKDRDIAMVFQTYAVYPHMTVYQNIEFPLKMRKVSGEERRRKVREVTEILGISHLLGKRAWQLSGGEQQRVALARALVRNPRLFLLDEPLSNLDAKLRVKLRFELRRLLHDELKITAVYVTHDQVEAMTMADRIAVMNEGRVIQFGTPQDVYTYPRNTFVAAFIGTPPMNILPGKVLNEKMIKIGQTAIALSPPIKIEEERVLIGIRPQHVVIDSADQGFIGKITSYENLGEDLIVHIDTEFGEIQAVASTKTASLSQIGKDVIVKPIGRLYIFDESKKELMAALNPREYTIT